jgi:hypothetical protein
LEVATRKEVEPEEMEPTFEELQRSLELPISHHVEESQGDVEVQSLQEDERVSKEKEPHIPRDIGAEEKDAPTLEESHVDSTQLPQDKDVQPASIKEEEESPILKEDTNNPIQTLDKLPQHGVVEVSFEVPTKKKVEPEASQPNLGEVPRSLELPINDAIGESQGDVGVQALQEGEHATDVEEPQIPHKLEAQEKEALKLEMPYAPSIEQPQDQDVKPTSIEEVEETPIVKEDTSVPIQSSHEFAQDRDVEAPLEVATREEVEPEQVEPTFEELPRSLELPISHHVEESQGDVEVQSLQEDERVYKEEDPNMPRDIGAEEKEAQTLEAPHVDSTQLPQDKDVQPASLKGQEESPILKEHTNDPIQALDEFPQHGDVEVPFEVPTENKVEPEEAEPSLEEVPRSLELPIKHAIEETQGDVGVKALQEGEHVNECKHIGKLNAFFYLWTFFGKQNM